MLLDEALEALGKTRVYPIKQMGILMFFMCLGNYIQNSTPLLSWIPPMFCAVKNASGIFPYQAKNSKDVQFFPLETRCKLDDHGDTVSCTRTDYLEPDPAKPQCSELSVVKHFPKCVLGNSCMYFEAEEGTTTVMSFNTICSREWLVRMEDATFIIGTAVGNFLILPSADTLGRKTVLLAICLSYVMLTSMLFVCPSSSALVTLRFLLGIGFPGLMGVCRILILEMNPPKERMTVSVLTQLSTTTGIVLLPLTSLAIPFWRWWIFSVIVFFFIVFGLLFCLSESFRWLLNTYNKDPIHYESYEISARLILQKLVEQRIKCCPLPRNVAELVTMKEELDFEGALEIQTIKAQLFALTRTSSITSKGSKLTGTSMESTEATYATFQTIEPEQKEVVESKLSDEQKVVDAINNEHEEEILSDEMKVDDEGGRQLKLGVKSESIILKGPEPKPKKKVNVLYRCLAVFMFMRTACMAYEYSLNLSANQLFDTNRFVSMLLLGLAEYPSPFFCILFDKKCQRRTAGFFVFMLSGVPFIIAGIWYFITSKLPSALEFVVFIVGKTAISMANILNFLHQLEVFPTDVRGTMMGIVNGVGRTLTIFAAFTPTLFVKNEGIILLILGGLMIICGSLVWLLPETKGLVLPQNQEDLNTIHSSTKSFMTVMKLRGRTSRAPTIKSGGLGGKGGTGEVDVEEAPTS